MTVCSLITELWTCVHTFTSISLVYCKAYKNVILRKSGLEQGQRWFVTDILKFRLIIIIIIKNNNNNDNNNNNNNNYNADRLARTSVTLNFNDSPKSQPLFFL